MASKLRVNAFKTAPAGFNSSTRGLESVFEYNGLTLNDRRSVDRYRLTAITGLDDADVRDTREVNPDFDGETAYQALYGGRTITLTGEIQTGNLDYLRYMQHYLKATFDDIGVEKDLLVRWHDWYDDFIADSLTIWKTDYTSVVNVGSEGVTLSNGTLVPASTQFRFIALGRQYEDYKAILKFHTGVSVTSSTVYLFGKYADATNHIEAKLTAVDFNYLQFSPANSGTSTLTAVANTLLANTDYWLVLRQQGIFVSVQLYTSDPDAGGSPLAETLVGTTENGQMGVGVVGGVGFGAQIGSPTGWYFESLDVRSLKAGDVVIPCKKVAKIEAAEGWNGFNYKLPFMLTLRASTSLKLSREPASLPVFGQQLPMGAAELTFPADGSGIPFDSAGTVTFGKPLGTAENLGIAPAHPVIRLTGPLQNPAIVNQTNNRRIVISGTIADSEVIEIDSGNRTAQDQYGRNRYDLLGTENNWLQLDPGSNIIVGGVQTVSSSIPTLTITSTNLVPYPSAEGNTSTANGWTRPNSNSTYPTTTNRTSRYGSKSYNLPWNPTGTGMGMISTWTSAVSPGDVISAGCEVLASTTPVPTDCVLSIVFYDVNGNITGTTNSSSFAASTSTWTRVTVLNVTAPATTIKMNLRLSMTLTSSLVVLYADGIIAVKAATLPAYFDGDSPGCLWEGQPHASRSFKLATTSITNPSAAVPGAVAMEWRHAFR
jgi:hypothetical protein